jgi:hypothetical protein
MDTLFTKLSGWFLLIMLTMLIVEILAVGVFALGWCLHSVFGHYAVAVAAVAALLIALFQTGVRKKAHK